MVFTTCPSPDAIKYGRNAFVPFTPVVHVHHALILLELGQFDFTVMRDAGVVDHEVDLAEMLGDIVRVGEDGFPLGNIEQLRMYVGALFLSIRSVSSRPAGLTSEMATLAPLAASWRARSRPMPEPAPVTTATLPLNSFTLPQHIEHYKKALESASLKSGYNIEYTKEIADCFERF